MAHMGFCDKHNMVAFLQKPSGSEEFHQIVDFLAGSHIRYALTANPTIYVSLVEQFWQTATVETVNDGEQQITVTVDGHKFAITEASVRRHLQLADVDGISSLPNTEIFKQLSLMGYPSDNDKLTFKKAHPIARVTNLETKLKKTKEVHGKALTKLVKKGRIEETEYADVEEETKYVEEENAGVEYDFDLTEQQVTPLKAPQVEVQSQETFKAELRVLSAAKILAEASKERVNTYNRRRGGTNSSQVSTAAGLVSTAEDIQDTDEEQTKALEQQEQERANLEAALKLQKQFDQERNEVDNIDWNKIVEQVQERQSGSMIRYQALTKKPVTVAQARKNRMVYLKNMENYKMSYFKGMSYDQIRPIFEEEFRKVQTLFKKNTDVEMTKKKRVAEEALLQESFKKLRTT
ncbi:hypothetical protein Tco_1074544 [Tanacetum coccineum]